MRFCITVIALSLSCGLLFGCKNSGAKDLAPGVPVTSYEVFHLDGSKVQLKDLFGQVTVVSFLASWCQSCEGEFAELNELHGSLSQKGGLVLGIALDDTLDDLRKTKSEHDLKFPIVFDSEAKARKFFKLTGFPETLILDSKGAPKLLQDVGGNFSLKFIGPRPWLEPLLKNQILGLL